MQAYNKNTSEFYKSKHARTTADKELDAAATVDLGRNRIAPDLDSWWKKQAEVEVTPRGKDSWFWQPAVDNNDLKLGKKEMRKFIKRGLKQHPVS